MKKNKKKNKPLTKDQLSLVHGFFLHENKKMKSVFISEDKEYNNNPSKECEEHKEYNNNHIYSSSYIQWLQRYVLTDIIEMNQKLESIIRDTKENKNNS